ncbi:MAG: hypothetical protein HOK28_07470, partial [Deltaproteobacteria bacterium]|nr:hypothetical protein [Deltaproteobacteria bacterium]
MGIKLRSPCVLKDTYLRFILKVWFACIIGIQIVCLNAQAAAPLILTDDQSKYSLGFHAVYLEDPDGGLTKEEALDAYQEGHFTQSTQNVPTFGFTSSVYWLAVELESQEELANNWIFQLAYPAMDSFELEVFHAGVTANSYRVGDRQPFSERIIDNRNFLLPITVGTKGRTLLLMRSQQFEGDIVELPIYLVESSTMSQGETIPVLADGIYIGIMLVMSLYNFLLFWFLKDKDYLFYVGYVLSTMLFMVSLRGWSYQFLWPNHSALNQLCFPYLLAILSVCVIEFSGALLSLPNSLPRTWKVMKGIELTAVSGALLTGILPYYWSYVVLGVYVSCTGVVILFGAGLYLWSRGTTTAKYYCVAFSSFILSCIGFSLAKVVFNYSSVWTEYIMQVGGSLEACLFSLALASKIKSLELESETHLEELTKEARSHADDIVKFNQSLSTKLFLFGDLAHRVNNPLNVAQGGTEVARATLDSFTQTVLSFFPVEGQRTQEEQIVVENLEAMAIKIGLSLEDSKAELSRAVTYVQDLRVVGGVDGDSPNKVELNGVVDKAMERISLDLGPKASLYIDAVNPSTKPSLMGQTAVLAMA